MAAVLGSVVTAFVLLSLRDDDSDTPASTGDRATSTPPPAAAGGGGGAELVALLEQGRKETFHAVYKASPPAGSSTNQEITLELWRKPPREREEVVQSSGGQSQRTAGFLLPPQSVICRQIGSAPWSCSNSGQAATQAEAMVKGLSDELAVKASAGRDDVVATRPVRCFSVPGGAPAAQPTGGAATELCLTKQGITARVSTEGSRVELVELSSDVADDVFTLPATPTG